VWFESREKRPFGRYVRRGENVIEINDRKMGRERYELD
jgi:hypothetical protein